MTRDEEFSARWESEKLIYKRWGGHICRHILATLSSTFTPAYVNELLKVRVEPRLKDTRKLIEKAFYRRKAYADPYGEITDKVGIRFVVLLGRNIRHIATAIEETEGWTWSKDRDYEEEQKENPVTFDYAAVHYIVRPRNDLEVNGFRIPAGTPCEVQIKTLLQHAYSELTHDTIYKPQMQATPAMQRNAAKSMALLEATNDYFEKVFDQVREATKAVRVITAALSMIYTREIGLDPHPSVLEGLLLEAYEGLAEEDYESDIATMLREKTYLVDNIRDRVARQNPLFAQPSILLAYLDVEKRGRAALNRWPLTEAEMEPLLNDFGESVH